MLNIIKKLWKWIKNFWKWLTSFAVIISTIISLIKLNEIKIIFYSIWGKIKVFYSVPYPISPWAFTILSLSFIITIIIIIIKHRNKIPDKYKYTKDKIFDINWEWGWNVNAINEISLIPICPKCITELNTDAYRLSCYRCNFIIRTIHPPYITDYYTLKDKVIKEIDKRVRTGEYKKKKNFKFTPEENEKKSK